MNTTVLSNEIIQQYCAQSIERVHNNVDIFGDKFPSYGNGAHAYHLTPNQNWLASFWSGLLWLTYAQSQSENDKQVAQGLLDSFEGRLDNRIHLNHDIGFLFLLSARAAYQLTGHERSYKLTLRASDYLLDRYRPTGQYIQAWKDKSNPQENGRFIIDCMMNLPLLFWAHRETGDEKYRSAAINHAHTSRQYLLRPDGSTNHTYFMDTETGEPSHAKTHQGYADDSLWSRGQAWAIYGFTLASEWTGEQQFTDAAEQAANRYMADANKNGIVLWDMRLPADEHLYPDSSADAITASGLLRLSKLTGNSTYRDYAEKRLSILIHNAFDHHEDAQGLVQHGTQHAPHNYGIDTYTIFGDYFFLEALLNLLDNAPDFWGKDSK